MDEAQQKIVEEIKGIFANDTQVVIDAFKKTVDQNKDKGISLYDIEVFDSWDFNINPLEIMLPGVVNLYKLVCHKSRPVESSKQCQSPDEGSMPYANDESNRMNNRYKSSGHAQETGVMWVPPYRTQPATETSKPVDARRLGATSWPLSFARACP